MRISDWSSDVCSSDLPSSKALLRWRRGQAAIPAGTAERIGIVLALFDRLVTEGDFPELRPLPALKRPGRSSLSGQALLEGGRLSDLLALWRQLVLAEEARRSEEHTSELQSLMRISY